MKWVIELETISLEGQAGYVNPTMHVFHFMRDNKVKAKDIISIEKTRKKIRIWYRVRRKCRSRKEC